MIIISPILRFVRRHRWKLVIGSTLLVLAVGIIAMVTGPKTPEYVTASATRGDLIQIVEAVGTVISERDLALQFPMTGMVARVYVKEGARVLQGQILAAIRSGGASADIASASARLQAAQADLRALQEGNRPEDIAVTEAEVQNKQAALASARSTLETAERSLEQSERKLAALNNEAAVNIQGYVTTVGSTLTLELTTAQNSLSVIENVLGNNDLLDAVIKYDPEGYELIQKMKNDAQTMIRARMAGSMQPQDYLSALVILETTRGAITTAWNVVTRAFDMVSRLPETASYTNADKEDYTNTLAAERTSLQSSLGTIDSTLKTLRDAVAGIDTSIIAEEASRSASQGTRDKALADIATYESALRIAEAQLTLKRAGARKTDIDSAQARVRQEAAALQRARADYANTVLVSPIAGTVTKVHVKTGELTPVGAAVTLLGETPYRIEMFVSEIDIPKVQVTQSGSIILDAFPDTNFQVRVREIDVAPTDIDGVLKYRVKLDFIYPHTELKIGMSGDVTIVTGKKLRVVSVPRRAVIEDDEGRDVVRVLTGSGDVSQRMVELGMEGEGGDVEIRRGLDGSETVIVLTKE